MIVSALRLCILVATYLPACLPACLPHPIPSPSLSLNTLPAVPSFLSFFLSLILELPTQNYWPWTDEFWNPPATTTTPVPTTAGANVLNTTAGAGLTTSDLLEVTGDSNPEGAIPEW